MNYFRFYMLEYGENCKKTVEVGFNALKVSEVIDEFETFLLACGYRLKGKLEIVEYPEED